MTHKQFWIHVYGYVIREEDRLKFYDWAKLQDFWNKWMPESHEFYSIYYGEFPYSDAFRALDNPYYGRNGWVKPTKRDGEGCPVEIMVANDEYAQEGNTSDRSVDDGFRIQMPSSSLYKDMQLSLSLDDGMYLNQKGDIAFMDPTVRFKGPNSLLASKNVLLEYLNKHGLTLAWTVIGEKQLIGGHSERFHKRLRINGVYTLANTKITGSFSTVLD